MKTDKITIAKLKSILANKSMQSYTTNIKVSRPYGGGPRKPEPPKNNKLDLILDRLTKIEENQKKDHELLIGLSSRIDNPVKVNNLKE